MILDLVKEQKLLFDQSEKCKTYFFQFLQNKKMSKIYFSRDSEKYSEFCNSHVAPFKEHNVWVPKYESIHEFLNKKQDEYDDEDRHEMRTGKNGNMRGRWEYYENNQNIRFENEMLVLLEQAIALKFDQNPTLKKLLLDTGDAKLIFNNKHDSFLGIGAHESGPHAGKNHLGRLLMEYREIKKYEDT